MAPRANGIQEKRWCSGRVDPAVLDRIAREAGKLLGVPVEALLCEGLKRFLASKIKENQSIMRGLEQKWGVSGYLELENRIKEGDVAGHPAWEDVILWEGISQQTEALQSLVHQLEAGDAVSFDPKR